MGDYRTIIEFWADNRAVAMLSDDRPCDQVVDGIYSWVNLTAPVRTCVVVRDSQPGRRVYWVGYDSRPWAQVVDNARNASQGAA